MGECNLKQGALRNRKERERERKREREGEKERPHRGEMRREKEDGDIES